MDIFEQASKKQLRFESAKGLLTVEDLWQLSLTALDTIAKKVNKEIRENEEESFISAPTKKKGDNTLKLDILKHVIATKIEERDAAKQKNIREAQIAQLKEVHSQKQLEELKELSAEELEKKIAELSV